MTGEVMNTEVIFDRYVGIHNLALPRLMYPSGLRVTQNAYISLLTPTKQLLLVAFCDTPVRIEDSFRTDRGGRKDRQTWKLK